MHSSLSSSCLKWSISSLIRTTVGFDCFILNVRSWHVELWCTPEKGHHWPWNYCSIYRYLLDDLWDGEMSCNVQAHGPTSYSWVFGRVWEDMKLANWSLGRPAVPKLLPWRGSKEKTCYYLRQIRLEANCICKAAY